MLGDKAHQIVKIAMIAKTMLRHPQTYNAMLLWKTSRRTLNLKTSLAKALIHWTILKVHSGEAFKKKAEKLIIVLPRRLTRTGKNL